MGDEGAQRSVRPTGARRSMRSGGAAGIRRNRATAAYDQNGRFTGETDSVEAVNWTGTATTFTQFPTNQGYGGTTSCTTASSPPTARGWDASPAPKTPRGRAAA